MSPEIIMNLPLELFFTIFPYVLQFAIILTMPFFWLYEVAIWGVLTPFSDYRLAQFALHAVIRSAFFSVGMLYLVTLFKVVRHKLKAKKGRQLSPTPQQRILSGTFVFALVLEVLYMVFQENIVVYSLASVYIMIPYLIIFSLGMVATLFFIARFIITKIITLHSPVIEKMKVVTLTTLGILPIIVVVTFMFEVFFSPMGNPQATRFAVLHAAIKNTCLIHPERLHCPTTLEEIGYIEPKYYQSMIKTAQASYQYYPEENNYTFIVRYSPTQAVIFDQRLVDLYGVDFKEYRVSVLGTDRIANPPEFLGEVEFEEWEY